jgi:hypothetical protein
MGANFFVDSGLNLLPYFLIAKQVLSQLSYISEFTILFCRTCPSNDGGRSKPNQKEAGLRISNPGLFSLSNGSKMSAGFRVSL